MSDCPFCEIAESDAARVVLADDVTVAFLDHRPVQHDHVEVWAQEPPKFYVIMNRARARPKLRRARSSLLGSRVTFDVLVLPLPDAR